MQVKLWRKSNASSKEESQASIFLDALLVMQMAILILKIRAPNMNLFVRASRSYLSPIQGKTCRENRTIMCLQTYLNQIIAPIPIIQN